MKVYSCPTEVAFADTDFANYDTEKETARVEAHKAALKAWLLKSGFTGPHTGEIASFPVGDGGAQYMMADGKKSCLIHLPYFDGYAYPDVQFLPKAEVLKRIGQRKSLASIFERKRA